MSQTISNFNLHNLWDAANEFVTIRYSSFFHFSFECVVHNSQTFYLISIFPRPPLQARVYLLCAGFSLAFGSMFAKTYRVHRIFTRTGSVFKDKMLQDAQLIMLVCILLVVDALLVTLWVFVDPMERHLHNLTLEINSIDRSVVYQPQVIFKVNTYTYIQKYFEITSISFTENHL